MSARILIVEDEMIIAEDVRATLKSLSYEVIGIASSGEEALELIKDNPPDLALMDIKINGPMNGIETTKCIQAQYDIPVIFLTAYADPDTVERVKETQAYGFIVKPVNRQTIQGTIKLAIFKHDMDRQLRDREERLAHVNQVLRAIRNVNQLITKETDRDRMLQGACDNLVETLGYQRAWIALYDHSDRFSKFAHAAPKGEFLRLQKYLEGSVSKYPKCVKLALNDTGISAIASSGPVCRNCPLHEHEKDFCRFTMKLEYADKVFGVMSVAVPLVYQNDEEEQELFKELVDDIAFALYKYELEEARELAERALRHEKSFTDNALNAQMDTFFVFDPENGKAVRWNKTFEDVSGYSAEEIAKLPAPMSYYSKEDLKRGIPFMERLAEEKEGTIELSLLTKDGRSIPYEYRVTGIQDPESGKSFFVSVGRDMTERQKMEAQIRESEEKFRAIVNETPMGMHVYKLEAGRRLVFVDNNPAASMILGVDCKQFVGKTIEEAFPPLAETEIPHMYRRAASDGIPWHSEQVNYEYGKILGAYEVFAFQSLQDFAVVLFNDITERKISEKTFKDNQVLLQKIAENYPHSYISIIEKDMTVGFTSGQEFKNQGLNPDDFIGLPLKKVFGENAPLVKKHYLKTFKGEETSFEMKIGEQFQLYQTVPLVDEDGKINRILAVVENVTERKKSEFALKESEERYKRLAEATFEGIGISRQGKVVDVNQQIAEIYGYSHDEFITKNFKDLVHPEDLEMVQSNMKNNITAPYEHRGIKKDGSVLFLEVRARPIVIENEECRLTVIRDITKRKIAEVSLKQKIDDLEKFNKLMVGREDRMIDLKREVNMLYKELGQKKKYKVPDKANG
ncbi:PAS domain S-box protein [candidate division KSB1 bacterium]|nr:PAS domain S-box protein [candidate division KSB1 bacterium]